MFKDSKDHGNDIYNNYKGKGGESQGNYVWTTKQEKTSIRRGGRGFYVMLDPAVKQYHAFT